MHHSSTAHLLTNNLPTEREVKKANRELHSQTAKMNEFQKIDHLTKRCSDLLAEMKLHQRENVANKKRADTLQREKDLSVSNLSKNTTLKEKLEKLCRELQKENNKLKVCHLALPAASHHHHRACRLNLVRILSYAINAANTVSERE